MYMSRDHDWYDNKKQYQWRYLHSFSNTGKGVTFVTVMIAYRKSITWTLFTIVDNS
jgi:hypothetical protein